MDESLINRIIHAARTGKLTEEQYLIYLRLLEEDPDFEQEIKWEEFLDKYLAASIDAEVYEAASKIKFPEKQPVFWQFNFTIAASLVLLLISGWFVFQYIFKQNEQPELLSQSLVELYSGDSIADGQIGYAEGELPIDVKTLKLWENTKQKEQVSYQFCSDTLQLYFRQIKDTTKFNSQYRLTYFSDTESYYLVSKNKALLKLTVCANKLQPLLK